MNNSKSDFEVSEGVGGVRLIGTLRRTNREAAVEVTVEVPSPASSTEDRTDRLLLTCSGRGRTKNIK